MERKESSEEENRSPPNQKYEISKKEKKKNKKKKRRERRKQKKARKRKKKNNGKNKSKKKSKKKKKKKKKKNEEIAEKFRCQVVEDFFRINFSKDELKAFCRLNAIAIIGRQNIIDYLVIIGFRVKSAIKLGGTFVVSSRILEIMKKDGFEFVDCFIPPASSSSSSDSSSDDDDDDENDDDDDDDDDDNNNNDDGKKKKKNDDNEDDGDDDDDDDDIHTPAPSRRLKLSPPPPSRNKTPKRTTRSKSFIDHSDRSKFDNMLDKLSEVCENQGKFQEELDKMKKNSAKEFASFRRVLKNIVEDVGKIRSRKSNNSRFNSGFIEVMVAKGVGVLPTEKGRNDFRKITKEVKEEMLEVCVDNKEFFQSFLNELRNVHSDFDILNVFFKYSSKAISNVKNKDYPELRDDSSFYSNKDKELMVNRPNFVTKNFKDLKAILEEGNVNYDKIHEDYEKIWEDDSTKGKTKKKSRKKSGRKIKKKGRSTKKSSKSKTPPKEPSGSDDDEDSSSEEEDSSISNRRRQKLSIFSELDEDVEHVDVGGYKYKVLHKLQIDVRRNELFLSEYGSEYDESKIVLPKKRVDDMFKALRDYDIRLESHGNRCFEVEVKEFCREYHFANEVDKEEEEEEDGEEDKEEEESPHKLSFCIDAALLQYIERVKGNDFAAGLELATEEDLPLWKSVIYHRRVFMNRAFLLQLFDDSLRSREYWNTACIDFVAGLLNFPRDFIAPERVHNLKHSFQQGVIPKYYIDRDFGIFYGSVFVKTSSNKQGNSEKGHFVFLLIDFARTLVLMFDDCHGGGDFYFRAVEDNLKAILILLMALKDMEEIASWKYLLLDIGQQTNFVCAPSNLYFYHCLKRGIEICRTKNITQNIESMVARVQEDLRKFEFAAGEKKRYKKLLKQSESNQLLDVARVARRGDEMDERKTGKKRKVIAIEDTDEEDMEPPKKKRKKKKKKKEDSNDPKEKKKRKKKKKEVSTDEDESRESSSRIFNPKEKDRMTDSTTIQKPPPTNTDEYDLVMNPQHLFNLGGNRSRTYTTNLALGPRVTTTEEIAYVYLKCNQKKTGDFVPSDGNIKLGDYAICSRTGFPYQSSGVPIGTTLDPFGFKLVQGVNDAVSLKRHLEKRNELENKWDQEPTEEVQEKEEQVNQKKEEEKGEVNKKIEEVVENQEKEEEVVGKKRKREEEEEGDEADNRPPKKRKLDHPKMTCPG